MSNAESIFVQGENYLADASSLLSLGEYGGVAYDDLFGADYLTVLPLGELLPGAAVSFDAIVGPPPPQSPFRATHPYGRAQVAKWNRPYQTTKLKRTSPPSNAGTNWRDVRILSLVMTMPARMQIG